MGKKLCSPSPRYMGVKELSKPRAANREKSIEDMDYEKNRQECTFKPQLIASKNYKSIQSHLSKASSSQQSCDRILQEINSMNYAANVTLFIK